MRKLKRINYYFLFLVLLLSVCCLRADIVYTFIGEGADVIHDIALAYKSYIRISAPGKELIKRVIYDKQKLRVDNNLHEIIVRPKLDTAASYLAVLTENNMIYIFRIKITKEENQEKHFTQHVIIKR